LENLGQGVGSEAIGRPEVNKVCCLVVRVMRSVERECFVDRGGRRRSSRMIGPINRNSSRSQAVLSYGDCEWWMSSPRAECACYLFAWRPESGLPANIWECLARGPSLLKGNCFQQASHVSCKGSARGRVRCKGNILLPRSGKKSDKTVNMSSQK